METACEVIIVQPKVNWGLKLCSVGCKFIDDSIRFLNEAAPAGADAVSDFPEIFLCHDVLQALRSVGF